MAQAAAAAHGAENGQSDKHFWALALGSHRRRLRRHRHQPALRAARGRDRPRARRPGPEAVLGILSLIVWTMLLIVTLKYVLVLLNADNKGEGGTFALMALGQSVAKRSSSLILVLGVVGAAFFYGDAVHHAGHLGAVGGGRPEAGRAADWKPRCCRSRSPSWWCCLPCSRAAPRRWRSFFGPDHAGLVRRAGDRRADPHRRRPARVPGAQSVARRAVRPDARRDRAGRDGPGLPGRDGCRGPLRRPRPFRPQADPGGVASRSCSRR